MQEGAGFRAELKIEMVQSIERQHSRGLCESAQSRSRIIYLPVDIAIDGFIAAVVEPSNQKRGINT